AIIISKTIVNSLYAPAAGNVVFCRGDFHLGVVGKIPGGLNQTFSISPLSDQDSPVIVLHYSRHDFGCGSTAATGQHHKWDLSINGRVTRRVLLVPFTDFPFGRYYLLSFR